MALASGRTAVGAGRGGESGLPEGIVPRVEQPVAVSAARLRPSIILQSRSPAPHHVVVVVVVVPSQETLVRDFLRTWKQAIRDINTRHVAVSLRAAGLQ
jgi:hypothetical protein